MKRETGKKSWNASDCDPVTQNKYLEGVGTESLLGQPDLLLLGPPSSKHTSTLETQHNHVSLRLAETTRLFHCA